jgi:hypothetical protein
MGMPVLNNFHLVKVKNTYLGCNHDNKKSVVFAFTQKEHAHKIKNVLRVRKCKIEQQQDKVYQVKPHYIKPFNGKASPPIEVEEAGLYDTQIHLAMNGVDMFIVDEMHVDDEQDSLSLVNVESVVEPLFINYDMQRMHLNRLMK